VANRPTSEHHPALRQLAADRRAGTERPDALEAEGENMMLVAMQIDVTPIGVVRSKLHARRDAPRQAFEGAPQATLEIDPTFAPALERVVSGTALIVVTWLHEADRTVLQVHPRDDERIPLTGVFATRSPDRPNPIGLHRVTVIGTGPPASVHVDALEAIDGTPILDLKVAMTGASDA
jgi:tRNA-Thr(GGU) m(6)t(6)A37 methyltransferase TsaA